MMNIIEINKRIKQRPPFQMVEKVLEVVPGESVKALKNVSVNEPYFMGHFPDAPIMPGVLVIESAAQAVHLQSRQTELMRTQYMFSLKLKTSSLSNLSYRETQ